MGDKLTQKQTIFVSEYLKTGNAAEAARRAGYSEKFAGQNVAKLLKNPNVSRAIAEKQAKRNERLELEEDYELKAAQELLGLAREAGDYKAAVSAVQTMAKIRGKFIQKVQFSMADSIFEDVLGIKDE